MYTRRSFLKTAAAGAVFLPLSSWSASEERKKPNIVIILADDLGGSDAGCYGNPDVKTPNIDGLAKEGMFFTGAFTATAMCSPTRQQLYTGVFPVRNGAYRNSSEVKPGTRSIVHYLQELGYKVSLTGKTHIGPKASFPFEKAGDNVSVYLRTAPSPFCLVYASHHPHLPWSKTRGYTPEAITVPPHLVDNAETRSALCAYYTSVTQFDAEVGTIMKALDEHGQRENTLVIVTSEQGAPFPGGKWTCYDQGLHTQFLVRWPGVVEPGSRTDAMIQYVDVLPTLLEAIGEAPERADTGLPGARDGGHGFDGRSFLPVLLGKAQQHNDAVFGVQTTAGTVSGRPYPIRSIRSNRYKYIWNLMPDSTFQNNVTENDAGNFWSSWVRDSAADPRAARLVKRFRNRPEEEFYDIQQDPHELTNLATDARFRKQMDDMRRQLREWMAQQGDKGIETENAKVP